MNLNNTGKKFVYLSIIMMALSMVLPWESLEDYTYAESVGIAFNILPAVLFVCSSLMVVLGPIAALFSRFGTNYVFLLLCLINAIALYFGMQYYPDTYTIGYLLFPSSIITFMLGCIFSVNRITGLSN
ncbi:hypothetical protein OAS25_03590 [Alphaproteobacteria bacterium]|jgi:hypothetical protein|nr:hypothetical protein [Alphaproteobacteria bacterium]MDB3973474.1 hypothetical protein [Alphaproteobacteria bacterium]MDC0968148.1 hypothetical protein [Alphaproteobacteria bacterium]MDG1883446.1 hypothetical protein [Alphaproteobacteria bacterium]|tara:strand:+ start:898 stop:1281 length:384 start_codon:yes stop_codon:yes gene_type:complete